jgi:hypothetical protein
MNQIDVAIKHYEAALKAAFPKGADGEVFLRWKYARQAIEQAERERCAQVCVAQAADADSAKRKPLLTQSGQMLYEGICGGAMNCAIAIRKGETK